MAFGKYEWQKCKECGESLDRFGNCRICDEEDDKDELAKNKESVSEPLIDW